MAFIKYSSITNSYDEVFIDKVKERCIDIGFEGPWYISEKIHGANCQVSYDEEGFNIGCRNSYEIPISWKSVLGSYEGIIENLYNELGPVALFGEFFGGSYPHPDVPRDPNAKRVQKGIFYTPHNEVLFYDLLIKDKGFLGVKDFEKIADKYCLPRVDFIEIPTLDEALSYPNDNPSKIYLKYSLPEIENNIMEGVVIKPAITIYAGQSRIIIKNKNERFKEVSKKAKVIHTEEDIQESTKEAIEKAICYVTEERVINCLSHFGSEPNMNILGELIKEANKDAIEAFEKENNDFNALDKVEIKKVTKRINQVMAKLCKEVVIKKMKGDL